MELTTKSGRPSDTDKARKADERAEAEANVQATRHHHKPYNGHITIFAYNGSIHTNGAIMAVMGLITAYMAADG